MQVLPSSPWGRTTNLCGLLKANLALRTLCSKYWGNKWIGSHSALLDSIPNAASPLLPLLAVFTHYYQCTYYMTVHVCMTSNSTADGGTEYPESQGWRQLWVRTTHDMRRKSKVGFKVSPRWKCSKSHFHLIALLTHMFCCLSSPDSAGSPIPAAWDWILLPSRDSVS